MGPIARVKVKSTFGALSKNNDKKRHFSGTYKWISNTFNSNSVRYHMHHRKNLSFLSNFGLRAVFVKRS